ncbi:MAG: mechanosensitive ion channel [Robiginitomaculum sp.]|nr:mechanosensitive ion channel [Robiginitomaculum sp.]
MEQIENMMGFMPSWAVGPVIALVTIIVGYFIAKIAGMIVSGGINKTGLGRKAMTTGGNIGKSLSKAVFWVLWLFFILMGLSRFPQLAEPLEGIKGMLNDIFGYLPQIFGAGFIFFIGWILAKIFREAATSTLEAAQVDSLASRFGAEDSTKTASNTIAKTIGGVVFAFVLFLFGVTALGVLDIDSITGPLTGMLDQVMGYIPQLISASVVLGLSIMIGKFVANLAKSTLPAMGFDTALSAIGELDGEKSSNVVPSKIIATIAFIGISLMGAIAAMNILGIDQLTKIFNQLLSLGGSITLGAIIIGVGFFIANVISRIASQTMGETVGKIIKYVTILIVTFMGLSQMGIGDEIVNTAFKSFVWAAAFAAGVGGAVAFGWGGHKWAGAKLEKWFPNKAQAKPRAKTRAKK